jgi:hypothetical protein
MERCQETSHEPPIAAEVTARTPHQTYQGAEAIRTDGSELVEVDITGLRLLSIV